MKVNSKDIVISQFQHYFGKPECILQSPSRVNIIGEHTDYHLGLVLPFASDRYIWFAAAKNQLSRVRIYSCNLEKSAWLNLDENQAPSSFVRYFHSAIQTCVAKAIPIEGFDVVFGGNIPIGAGMSSSSSLTCGILSLINKLGRHELSRKQIISLASIAENNTGVEGGKMDQTAIMLGKSGNALLIDFYSESSEYIPLNLQESQFVLLHSNVSHTLADSAYNDRRKECENQLKLLNTSLSTNKEMRQLDLEIINEAKKKSNHSFEMLSYVVEENLRVLQTIKALKQNNNIATGNLLYQSHEGLSKKYLVSCPELDFIVEECKKIKQVYGARMMGGGFGGCAICLIKKEDSYDSLFNKLSKDYSIKFNKQLKVIPVKSVGGLSVL